MCILEHELNLCCFGAWIGPIIPSCNCPSCCCCQRRNPCCECNNDCSCFDYLSCWVACCFNGCIGCWICTKPPKELTKHCCAYRLCGCCRRSKNAVAPYKAPYKAPEKAPDNAPEKAPDKAPDKTPDKTPEPPPPG